MKIDGRMSYDELIVLSKELQVLLIGKYLKKVYHYNGKWMFKFNNLSFVFEPGFNIWTGEFLERETQIHSVCNKIRKEVLDQRVLDLGVFNSGRTFYVKFNDYYLFFEVYDKGNLIMTDSARKIIVLTRIHEEVTHGSEYPFDPRIEYPDTEYSFGWKKQNYEISLTSESKVFDSWVTAVNTLWNVKNTRVVKIKEKKNKGNPIQNQIANFDKKICVIQEKIEELEDTLEIDFETLNKTYIEKKLLSSKKEKANEHLKSKVIGSDKPPKECLELSVNRWYQDYHWWYTKNNILVVGGRNADQNEKLVKSYLKPTDLYLHSEEPGSGSFIMFIEEEHKSIHIDVDIEETAQGLIALTNTWKVTPVGVVYYVKGDQVSKTPPTGEFVTKGSFIVTGTRNFIKVENLSLGYGLHDSNQLMLAPYRIISRMSLPIIRLTPKLDSKKNIQKELTKKIKQTFYLNSIPECIYIFPHPSTIFVKT